MIAQLKAATCDLCDAEGEALVAEAAMRCVLPARGGVARHRTGVAPTRDRTARRGRFRLPVNARASDAL